jgi:hypothetical protein
VSVPSFELITRAIRSPSHEGVETNLKGEQGVGTAGLWVFVYLAIAAQDVRITSGLTSLQCAMLINTFNGVYKNQNDRGEWSCISPEGQQFKTAKEMGIRLPSSTRP